MRSCPQTSTRAACFLALSQRALAQRLFLTSRCSRPARQACSAQQDRVLKWLRPFALSTDKCHLSFETEIGYWSLWLVKAVEFFFFQDGLAETWQTEMFSWAAYLKVQSPSTEKYEYQPDFQDGETLQVNSTIGSTYASCLPQVLYQYFFSSPLVFCRLQTLRGWKQAPSFFWFPHGT